MKDALGHGSDAQAARELSSGGPKSKPVNVRPVQGASFGKRNTTPAGGPGNPNVPAHMSRIGALVSEFVKSESGAGRVPEPLKEFDVKGREPSDLAETGRDMAHDIHNAISHHDKVEPSALLNLLHFLSLLGAIAVTDVIVQSIAHAFGVTLS